METVQTTAGLPGRPAASRDGDAATGLQFEQQHRAQICATVYEVLSAARSGTLTEYLGPLPITRLHAAQRAFREIGAAGLATAVRTAQFGLTRVGAPLRLAQAVADLSTALSASTEDVDQLIATYWRVRLTAEREYG